MKTKLLFHRFIIIVFLCAMSSSAKEINEIDMIHRDGNIIYYEINSNHIMFAEQYQLLGMIANYWTNATHAMFWFSGDVQMTISGEQCGVIPRNKSKCLKWHVSDLPVKVSRWEEGETARWGSVRTTFEQFTQSATDHGKGKKPAQIALHIPKLVFSETGDILWIEAEQAVLKRSEVSTSVTPELKPPSVAVEAQSPIHAAFDLKRAVEIVKGTVLPQMIEKVTICNKFMSSDPKVPLEIAAVVEQTEDIASLISALKESWVPPEPKDPHIKPGNWWGYEFRFQCKDHHNAVLSVFVGDGYYEMVGHRNPGERYRTLVHQDNVEEPPHKSCFFTQNLHVGKWLDEHGLPFREGTWRGVGTTDANEIRGKRE